MKVGVMTPLYSRPDFARFAAMQFAMQTRKPDHVAFYQNGEFPDYQWAISDLALPYKAHWVYANKSEPNQSAWYAVPLKKLLSEGCDYIFWCDQDDIYRTDHIEETLRDFYQQDVDIVLTEMAGLLKVRPGKFVVETVRFRAHSPGGVSSSMAFNATAANVLYDDLVDNLANEKYFWADNVVSEVTMHKFKVYRNPARASVTYVCHTGTVSSSHWLNDL
jgi:hypothetical protein